MLLWVHLLEMVSGFRDFLFKHLVSIMLELGHGEGIVVATGKSTEFGHVFELMQEVKL